MNRDRNDRKRTMNNSKHYNNSGTKTSRNLNNNDLNSRIWKSRGGSRHKRYYHVNSNDERDHYTSNHWARRGAGFRGRYSKRGGNACHRRNYSDHSWMKSYEDMIWDNYDNEDVAIDLPKVLQKLRADSLNTRYFSNPLSIRGSFGVRKHLNDNEKRPSCISEDKLCSRCFRVHPYHYCILRRCFICSSRYHSPFVCPWRPIEGEPVKSCKYCDGISYNLNNSFDYSISGKHVCNNFNNESIDGDFDDIYNDDSLNIIDVNDCIEYNERMYNSIGDYSHNGADKSVRYNKNSRVNNSDRTNANNSNIVNSYIQTRNILNSVNTRPATDSGIVSSTSTSNNVTGDTARIASIHNNSDNDSNKSKGKTPFTINFRGRTDVPEDFNSCIRKGYEESILFMADESTVDIREELEIVCYSCSKRGHIICNSVPPFQNSIKKAYCALCGEVGHNYELCNKYKRRDHEYYFEEEFEYLLSLEERRYKREQLKIENERLEQIRRNNRTKLKIYDNSNLDSEANVRESNHNDKCPENKDLEKDNNVCDNEYEYGTYDESRESDSDSNSNNDDNNKGNNNNWSYSYYHNIKDSNDVICDADEDCYREEGSDQKKVKKENEFQPSCNKNPSINENLLDDSNSNNKLIRRSKNGMKWLSGMKSFSRSELISINSISTIETSEYNKYKIKRDNSMRDCNGDRMNYFDVPDESSEISEKGYNSLDMKFNVNEESINNKSDSPECTSKGKIYKKNTHI
ncbi:hypothetical protein FG379_000789 [Cryptosporidium bovis]|uniref:uncharacterized protein n=1 Tax=Cryptosporidium bovis TaxID=310047 RepID=UPI00351A235A|nr:hypothetical protein FG379_000789 [Cryptosporidium bovis]